MVIALVGIAVLFEILTKGILSTPLNVTNIIMQNSYIIILAIGMTLVIIVGEIDLSVGSVAAFIGAVAGALLVTFALSVYLAIILCLLAVVIIGAWQVYWVAYVTIYAYILTVDDHIIFHRI